MDAGDGGRIDESVLGVVVCTGTFFSLRRTTESRPLMPMAVRPQVLTALKAYSTWYSLPSGEKTVMKYSWPWLDLLIRFKNNLNTTYPYNISSIAIIQSINLGRDCTLRVTLIFDKGTTLVYEDEFLHVETH